jgi:signal transduction histidine kinase
MTLRRQLALTSLAVALPAAFLMTAAVNELRDRDRRAALLRVGEAHLSDMVRDACQADPVWFLAGPRTGQPTAAQRAMPDADVHLPRPDRGELPFEVFAYDRNFEAASSAAPRFPEAVRRQLRGRERGVAFGTYASSVGEGLEMGMLTGWSPGLCAVLLFRHRPEPGSGRTTVLMFSGFFVTALLIAGVVTARTERRVRTLAHAVHASAREDYALMAPVGGRDEVGALGAAFNEAASDIRRRAVDVRDREDALRRHVRQTSEEVAVPLADLEARLASLSAEAGAPEPHRAEMRRALDDAHHLVSRLNNLAAVARLRTNTDQRPHESVDVGALVERVVSGRVPLAQARNVDVAATLPSGPVLWQADPILLEQALANVIDNAILHNRPGGRVTIDLKGYDRDRRFTLRVIDDGPGVTDEAFAALTANRRFRGDEGRSARAGRGLGLAVAREVTDRVGLQLELRRPSAGGFEVEFSVR